MKIENDQYREKNMGPLFDICANRHQGNEHSIKSNAIAHKYKIGARQRILEELQVWTCSLKESDQGGRTCEELEHWTGLSHQTCSARLSELRREGKIKIVGERNTRSGSPASVYQAA